MTIIRFVRSVLALNKLGHAVPIRIENSDIQIYKDTLMKYITEYVVDQGALVSPKRRQFKSGFPFIALTYPHYMVSVKEVKLREYCSSLKGFKKGSWTVAEGTYFGS